MRGGTSTSQEFLEELLISEPNKLDHLLITALTECLGEVNKAINICLVHLLILSWLQYISHHLCHENLLVLVVPAYCLLSVTSSDIRQYGFDPVEENRVRVGVSNLHSFQEAFDQVKTVELFIFLFHFFHVNRDKV